MDATITVGALQQYALEQIAAQANAARPLDGDGQPIGAEVTAAQYLQARVADVLQDYCRAHCRISGASAILRLTNSELGRIRAAMAASPQVKAAADPLLQGQRVELAGPLWTQGVQMLAGAGLLDTPTQDRVAALLLPPQDGETVV